MRRIIIDYLLDSKSIAFIMCLVLYIIIRLLYLLISKKSFTKLREIMLLIFWGSLFFVLAKTVLPTFTIYQIDGGIKFSIYRGDIKFNIVPFKSIAYFFSKGIQEDAVGSIINLLGNILLFVPIGFSSMYLLKYSLKKSVLFGCLISIIIETLQIIPGRSIDIDDVILNTLGAFIGCCVISGIKYLLMKRKV